MRKKAKSKDGAGFWRGLLLGGAVAAAAAYFIPPLLKTESASGENQASPLPLPKAKVVPESPQAPKPKPQQTGAKPTVGIPLFRRPDMAAGLAVRSGLGESYPGSLRWKKADALGWNSFGTLNTPIRGAAASDGAGNSVTSLLESRMADRVEEVLLVANISNARGEAETIEKFRSLALTFLNETGCPATREFVAAIGVTDMETQTPDARYALKKVNLNPAYRWELSIKSK